MNSNEAHAPAQAREEEADPMALPREIASGMRKFISMVRDDEGGVHGWNFETENAAQWIASQLAALRSRQSPQAADTDLLGLAAQCLQISDPAIRAEPSWEADRAEFMRRYATAPQPSPQGEDAASDIVAQLLAACNGHPYAKIKWPHRLLHDAVAEINALRARLASAKDWCDLMVDEFTRISHLTENEEIKGLCERASTNTKQHFPIMKQRDDFYARWIAEKARAEELEARLASAQSSAQGEEAREMRDAIDAIADNSTPDELGENADKFSRADWMDAYKLCVERAREARAVLERKETK